MQQSAPPPHKAVVRLSSLSDALTQGLSLRNHQPIAGSRSAYSGNDESTIYAAGPRKARRTALRMPVKNLQNSCKGRKHDVYQSRSHLFLAEIAVVA